MSLQNLAGRHGIGDAGGRAEVVLEHLERAVAIAHDIQAGDRDPRADLLAHARQPGLVVLRAVEAGGRHHPGLHDPPFAVDIPDEQLQCPHALSHAG